MTYPKPAVWTRERFLLWLTATCAPILADPPYDLAPCTCGDVNCHGWRVVHCGKADA